MSQIIEKEFYLDEYLAEHKNKFSKSMSGALDTNTRFLVLCNKIKDYFKKEWEKEYSEENSDTLLERQKMAILGYPSQVNYYKDKIKEYLQMNNLANESFPSYYKNLVDAIFHENWGLCGIAPWMDMTESSSCKIIGDRIYFSIDGKLVLQPQRISSKRFEQLRKALLLNEKNKRLDEEYVDVYLSTGERIAIYTGNLVPQGMSAMVFRRSIIETLTFEEQANRHTIPMDCIQFLISMVKIGVRIAFTGPVGSGKTTMLNTFLMYEDRNLEGVLIQTDNEIKINELLPNAPNF